MVKALGSLRKHWEGAKPILQEARDLNHLCNPHFSKSLLCTINPRAYQQTAFGEWSGWFQSMLDEVETVQGMAMLDNAFELLNGLEEYFSLETRNLLPKSYLMASAFVAEAAFCQHLTYRDMLANSLAPFRKLTPPTHGELLLFRQQPAEAQSDNARLMAWDSATILLERAVYHLMTNVRKKQRAITKLHESVSYCLHFMVKDEDLMKELTFYNWVNRLGLSLAGKQVLLGFTLDLYGPREYPYLCYMLVVLLDSWRRHAKTLHDQLNAREPDLALLLAHLAVTPKLKKKAGTANIQQQTEFMFLAALHRYFHATFELLKGLELDRWGPAEEELQYCGRIRMLRATYFVKGLAVKEYQRAALLPPERTLSELLAAVREATKEFKALENF